MVSAAIITFPQRQSAKSIAQWIKDFEQDYFTRRRRDAKSETTWKIDYLAVFRRLPNQAPLTAEVLMEAILSTAPDTKTRKRFCMVLGALARFAGVSVNLKQFGGTYSPKKTSKRILPSDAVIASWFEQISSPEWRWAYGMLATYGLRPHELFHLNLQKLKRGNVALEVLDGKTGPRLTLPFYPEWFELFDLRSGQQPHCTGATNADLGHRVSQTFRRLNIPFRAYDLRHCWAIRSMEFGLELSLAAMQMGHSVKVHSETYHHWINERRQLQAFQALLQKRDRPIAPN